MHRVEIRLKNHLPDARGLGLVRDISDLGIMTVSNVRLIDIYWIDADLPPDRLERVCRELLADPVTQEYRWEPGFSVERQTGADLHCITGGKLRDIGIWFDFD